MVVHPAGCAPTPLIHKSLSRSQSSTPLAAVVAVSGVSALPRYCLLMTGCFFGLGLAINVARDLLPPKYGRWLPIPLAMALPFYLGAWLGVSTAIGALVVIYWR